MTIQTLSETLAQPTRRELEVLRHLCSGKSPAEIAKVRKRSKRTIDFHIDSLFAKRRVRTVIALVRDAIVSGLAPNTWKPRHHCALSPKELAVIRFKAEGMSVQGIADEIVISPRTVDFHISNILAKWRVDNCLQAVLHAQSQGLLDW